MYKFDKNKNVSVNIFLTVSVLLYDFFLFLIISEFEYGIQLRDEIVPGITRLFLDYKICLLGIPILFLIPLFFKKLKSYREYIFMGVLISVIIVSIVSCAGFAAVQFIFPCQILDVPSENLDSGQKLTK